MKVLIYSPTYFNPKSFIGGAERYVEELSQALSKVVPTRFVSYGEDSGKFQQEMLVKSIYPVWLYLKKSRLNPLNLFSLKEIFWADVVYIHGVCTMMSDLCCIFARLLGKRVYVMDHGGGAEIVLNRRLPIYRFYSGGIAQSDLARIFLPVEIQAKTVVIKGGIDLNRFKINSSKREKKRILFVGRLLSHKGVDQLILACQKLKQEEWKLVIIGNIYHQEYFQYLCKLAKGHSVEFIHGANDDELIEEYQKASILVLPSTKKDCYGNSSDVPELMGFVLMEAQACGTPVICTDIGATQEFVDLGKTGYVVQQNNPEQLRIAIEDVFKKWENEGPELEMKCRNWVERFSWENVVRELVRRFQNV